MNPHPGTDTPSEWVARFAPLMPSMPERKALDLACGAGRHSRLLASLGHAVLAVDRDDDLLARAAGPGIETMRIDLESDPPETRLASLLAPERFCGIVITNYLHRPLFPDLLRSLAPGGAFIMETFAAGNARFGKPSNPAFLLAPGELLRIIHSCDDRTLRIVAYEDGYAAAPRPAMIQRICAVRVNPDEAQGIAPERIRIS